MSGAGLVIAIWSGVSLLVVLAASVLYVRATRRERQAVVRADAGPPPEDPDLDLVASGLPDRRHDPTAPRVVRTRPLRRMVH